MWRAGLPINRDVFKHDMLLEWGETRSYQWPDAIAPRCQLADRTASPDMAALIAVSALYRQPALGTPDHDRRRHASEGAITSIWGSCCAVPPPLRQALATQRRQLIRAGAATAPPPATRRAMGACTSTQAIENALAELDAPASMWTDGPDIRDHFEGPAFDGRSILHWLNPLELFDLGSPCR